jgi:hypothetical protein
VYKRQGLHYRWMKPPSLDFQKAYQSFSTGSNQGDSMCAFMKGYLHYKGLGCSQDYSQAALLFRGAANKGVSNGMYFLGLCFRNGYGIGANEDSAQYWLHKAAIRSNQQALLELESPTPENGNNQARNMARAISQSVPVAYYEQQNNQYQKIEESLLSGKITGKYTGHIIKYDWSGKNVVAVAPLQIELYSEKGTIYGQWIESDSLKVPLTAKLNSDGIEFLKISYKRTDHYSPKKAVLYEFENAILRWGIKNDTVFIDGEIKMFSPARNEPHKPQSIVLTKTGSNVNTEVIRFANVSEMVSSKEQILAYPNPFKNGITIDFVLNEKYEVYTELFTMDGRLVYSNRAGLLNAGIYTLPIAPKAQLNSGIYLLVLHTGNKTRTVKVVKE